MTGSSTPPLRPAERPLKAFISSVMDDELKEARRRTVEALQRAPFLTTWAFEYTPASSEAVDRGYLRHVRESDVVFWLAGSRTTAPVRDEVREALASERPRLLALKLPAAQRDDSTQALFAEVGMRAKWAEVQSIDDVGVVVELSLSDEIVRALRGIPGLSRIARLEELGRASRARCIARWQAAGVPRSEALEFADDPTIGAPDASLRPSPQRPLVILTGVVGAGKSLTAERLLQESLARAISDRSAPVPVHLLARACAGRLEGAVREAATGLGDPGFQGAILVVDGADEAGLGSALELVTETRLLVETWPDTTAVITTRPLPGLGTSDEIAIVPHLDRDQSLALVCRLAGRNVSDWTWPAALKDAIQRPLFAVLLGLEFRTEHAGVSRSRGELLARLAERALRGQGAAARDLLEKLGRLSTERSGSAVPLAEMGAPADIGPLQESGLILEQHGAVQFPLPILTHWFAAQSLLRDNPDPQEVAASADRLERWRFPLAIAVGSCGFEPATRLLRPIVERDPAFAAQIVDEGLASWGGGEPVAPPPALESAAQVRLSMETWLAGIGPLARLIGPLRPDKRLASIGAHVEGTRITTAWSGREGILDTLALPAHVRPFSGRQTEWFRLREAPAGHQPAWAWRWSLQELVDELSDVLRQRTPLFAGEDGPLARESAWRAALALLGHGSLYHEPLALDLIEERLEDLGDAPAVAGVGGRSYELISLRAQVSELRASGEEQLRVPWPTPDLPLAGRGWVWEPYSDARLLARATAVFSAALEGYEQLVRRWFSSLAPRLQTAATLPACLRGRVGRGPGRDISSAPTVQWLLDPLPPGQRSAVRFELGSPSISHEEHFKVGRRVRQLRPTAGAWIDSTLHHGVLDVFGGAPALELAYGWLWSDLARVAWVTGMLGGPQ